MEQRVRTELGRIPGFADYRRKEDRRDDDKRIRVGIADTLSKQVDALTRLNAGLVEARNLTQISRIERAIGQIRLLGDRVRTATYGYGGLFTENSVDEQVLDQLRHFDLALQREIDALAALVTGLSSAGSTPTDADVAALNTEITRLSLLIDSRTQVVDTAKPHQDADVLSLLATNPPPPSSPLLSLALGDTFSVLGENYQTDAMMTLIDGDVRFHLARVGENKQGAGQWFLASSNPEVPSAFLVENETDPAAAQPMKSAAANVHSGKGKRDGVSAQYAFTANAGDDGAVSFSYVIGDEVRHMAGRRVNDIDVEVYGSATS
ncbi:MAG: hypothetical protein H0W23_07405 [Chloroflexia bacterium]|nr:hypothetical protein [Chloroflexia bacterium]